jgi:hypothetical protein
MRTLLILAVLASHGAASVPFWNSIRRGKIPRTADFAAASFILYYDIGLAFELLGYPFVSNHFKSLLTADDGTFSLAVFFLTFAPWLLHAGSWVTSRVVPRQLQVPVTGMSPSGEIAFCALAVAVAGPLVIYNIAQLIGGLPLWEVRSKVGLQLGPMVLLLYLPLCFLAFFISQANSRSRRGLLISVLLAALSILSTIVLAERWTVLLPLLIIALFRFRLTLPRLAAIGVIGLVLAAFLLANFKIQFSGDAVTTNHLFTSTISADISRAGTLATAIEDSRAVGTTVLPYPGAGYLYTGLVYFPRQVAPFKGHSTAIYFTSYLLGTNPAEQNWPFGLGYLAEIMLNLGLLFVLPGLVVYGMGMGLLDRLSWKVPATLVATRLLVVWLAGYDLGGIFPIFGTMGIIGLALHFALRVRRVVPERSARSHREAADPPSRSVAGTTRA